MARIYRCTVCHAYTMQQKHCEQPVHDVIPAKYSPHDKLGKYRRTAKEAERKDQGVL